MCHPDGDIALFNDSAFGMTPSPQALAEYAQRLGIQWPNLPQNGAIWLEQTGYVRLQNDVAVIFCDAAPLGPDWQPGHGHADTLTWECSLFGQRVVVDSGTSSYAATNERLRQRGSAAHNTIMIDGHDSSEVWSAFRVARRARVYDASLSQVGLGFSASHDGYRKQGIGHRRIWSLSETGLEINDYIDGDSTHRIESNMLFHPDILLSDSDAKTITVKHCSNSACRLLVRSEQSMESVESTYHPRFGECAKTKKIQQKFHHALPLTIKTSLSWSH